MPTADELYNEADRLKDEGRLDEAVAKLQEILAAEPTYALAHAALAVIHTRTQQHDAAIQHALKVCELEPHDPFSFTALSVTYQRAFVTTNNHGYIQAAEDAMARARILQQR